MLSEQDLYKIKEIIGNSQEIDAKSKNELLDKFNKANLNGYGLNFVRSTEDIEKETYPYNKDKFIFLNEDTEKEIFKGEDLTNNILFEGDNLESLQVLKSTHKGKIDVIYIDPPYNTGNKDFVYNDSFVSNDDGFKHSKWLAFMEKRLRLAYHLLSREGVIFISIGDNEQANLKILCDSIFGEHNFMSNLIWQQKYTVSNDKKDGVTSQTEFILMFAKDRSKVELENRPLREEYVKSSYKNPDNDPRGEWMTVQMYKKKNPKVFEVESPTGKKWKMPWNFSRESWEDLEETDMIYWGKDGNSLPRKKVFLKDSKGRGHVNLLLGEDYGYTSSGTEDLYNVFGTRVFDYPKPVKLIKYLINMHPNKNATVLDFFAGSGTTGHAVLELNKEDGGNRNFILCTNNENNICEEVTYQRLSKVINGYTTPKGKVVEGIPTNLNYFKVDYIDTNEVYDFSDVDVIPYIELKEGVRYNFIDDFEYCLSKNKYVFLVVIEDDMLKVQEFLQNNDEKEVVIYCNSQSIKNKYFNTEFYPLFKSIDKDTILNISKDK